MSEAAKANMIEAVKARIEDRVQTLANRTRFSADFSALLENNEVPARTTAYIMLAGERGGDPTAMSGVFVQPVTMRISIVLCIRSTKARAEDAVDDVQPLLSELYACLLGWSPGDEVGVFQLEGGNILGFRDGALFYGVDLSITDQLRIAS